MTNQTLSKTGFNSEHDLSVSKRLLLQSDTIPLPRGRKSIVGYINAFTEGVNLLDSY